MENSNLTLPAELRVHLEQIVTKVRSEEKRSLVERCCQHNNGCYSCQP